MSQLDDFREQLRMRPTFDDEDERKPETVERPVAKKMKKKKDVIPGRAAVWIPKETFLRARLLCVWLDSEGIKNCPFMGEVIAEAVEYLIENKYPKAKSFVKHL